MNKALIPNEALRRVRLARHWTQGRLAHELGVDEQTVRSWERGTRTPSLEYRRRLCDLFSLPPEHLGLPTPERPEQVSQGGISPPADVAQYPLPEEFSFPSRSTALAAREQQDKNRHRFLKHVHTTWIAGVLQQSLQQGVWISLSLQERPDALANPWHQTVQETRLPPRSLPEGTSITQIYDDTDGQLLILGEPGAGKTTQMLALTRELLKRAEQDEQHPLPVVLNLSSWATKQSPLATWLVEELSSKYRVPPKVGQAWVDTNQLLLLLDGLDEVAEAARPACMKAINRYLEEQAAVPIILCCRKADYYAQPTRIALQRAVVVQPLTPAQVEEYLAFAGEQFAAVRDTLVDDPELQEIVKTPLMLAIVALAYQGETSARIEKTGSLEMQRRQVFATYIWRVLERRGARACYHPEQTIRWLSWLARQMTEHSQTECYVERLQPDWLPDGQARHRYLRVTVRLVFGLLILISAGLFAWLRGGKRGTIVGIGAGLFGRLGGGPGNSLLGWMSPGLGGALEGGGSLGIMFALVTVLTILLIGASPLPSPSARAVRRGLAQGLRSGLFIGALVGDFSGILFSLSRSSVPGWSGGLSAGIFTGLVVGMMTGLHAGLRGEQEASPGQGITQSDTRSTPLPQRFLDALVFTCCALLGTGGVYALLIGEVNRNVIIYSAIISLYYGVTFGFGGGTRLIPGLGRDIQPVETVFWSWSNVGQEFAGNMRKGLTVGLAVMGCAIVAISGASSFFYGAEYGLRYGLVYGCIVGLVGAVASVLTGMLNSGWSGSVLTEDQLFRPNEGISSSLRNAAFAACLFGPLGGVTSGLVCGLAFGLIGGLAGWPILAAGFALIFGIVFAVDFALIYGGIAWIEHYLLRWYLWRADFLPWNVVAFLNYASERILLNKIGGGYLFSHRLLQEYLATLDTALPCRKKASQSCSCSDGCDAAHHAA